MGVVRGRCECGVGAVAVWRGMGKGWHQGEGHAERGRACTSLFQYVL